MSNPSQLSSAPLILIVDDEPLVRKMLTLMLQRAGYQIDIAVNGRQALDKIYTILPDLITLDYMMPDFSGEEVKKHISQDSRTENIPIIFVSAVADELEARPGAHDREDVRYLQKPFQQDILLTHVSELLAWRKRQVCG
jgi:CheY-like chemotaxis protein